MDEVGAQEPKADACETLRKRDSKLIVIPQKISTYSFLRIEILWNYYLSINYFYLLFSNFGNKREQKYMLNPMCCSTWGLGCSACPQFLCKNIQLKNAILPGFDWQRGHENCSACAHPFGLQHIDQGTWPNPLIFFVYAGLALLRMWRPQHIWHQLQRT